MNPKKNHNILVLFSVSPLYTNSINSRMAMFDEVETQELTNAVVFLTGDGQWCAGDMICMDMTRNGIHFNNGVIYVLDKAQKNQLILNQYKSREFYIWECDKIIFSRNNLFKVWQSHNIGCKLEPYDKDEK